MVDWSPRPLGTRMVGRSPKAISIKGSTRTRAVSLAGRPLLQSAAPEARLSASPLRALRQTEMGPSGPEHMERDFGISPKSLRGNDIGSLSPHAGVPADLGPFPRVPRRSSRGCSMKVVNGPAQRLHSQWTLRRLCLLTPLYRSCGFIPTNAGLIRL